LNPNIAALQEAIDKALAAISEGKGQVEVIITSTSRELERLEGEYAQVKEACAEAIARVEVLEAESRSARERLVVVSRELRRYGEEDMRSAYSAAERAQAELAMWREREAQLRRRRDELARQLKTLQVTLHHAETLLVKFDHVSHYLASGFNDLSGTLQTAYMDSLLGLRMLQMQEDERRWLAQTLHDGPMQSLASVVMKLEARNGAAQDRMVDEAQRDVRDVIRQLRRLAFDLRPPLIDDLGLIPALKRYVQQWTKWTGLEAKVQLIGLEVTLGQTEKMAVFRAVQEALHNVAQHASATRVEIRLIYGLDRLQVVVKDDGVGIGAVDWRGWLENGRIGLTLTSQRLAMLRGTLEVRTGEAGGTEVLITVPIDRKGFAEATLEGGDAGGRTTTHPHSHRR
jgi:two-component system sensor histidine kinase DegS